MNKKIINIILACCLISQNVSAQFIMGLSTISPAPMYFSDWNYPSAGILTVVYNRDVALSFPVKLRTRLIHENGDIIAASNDAAAATYSIRPGPNTFMMDKVFQYENLQFFDAAIANSIRTSGKLPPGNYQLCIYLLDSRKNSELTQLPVCRSFLQVSYQLPYLLIPNDQAWLDANTAQSVITFRWTSLVPQSKEKIIYRLQIFEVLVGQEPVQALRSNQPILDAEIRNTTQYFWRPQLSIKDSTGHIFVWTVQTLDSRNVPITSTDVNSQGRSEPRVFTVGLKSKNDTLQTDANWTSLRKF